MFVLAEIKDVVRTPPSLFNKSLQATVTDYLNGKLANKVSSLNFISITIRSFFTQERLGLKLNIEQV